MTLREAVDIVRQLSRIAAVNGEVGDKRDEALQMLDNLVENNSEDEEGD